MLISTYIVNSNAALADEAGARQMEAPADGSPGRWRQGMMRQSHLGFGKDLLPNKHEHMRRHDENDGV